MKLEDLPKKDIFNVPDGYFEELPSVIQARVAAPSKAARPVLRYALQYALPVVVLLAAGIFWFAPGTTSSTQAETLLAEVNTEDLIAFLNDTDISTDELLDHGTLDASDATEIEGEVYGISLDNESIDALTEEYDLNNL